MHTQNSTKSQLALRARTQVPKLTPKTKKIEEQESIPPILSTQDSFVGLPDVKERTECMFEDIWVQGVLSITHDDVIFEPEAQIKDMQEPESKAPMSPPPGLKQDSDHGKHGRHSSTTRRGSVRGVRAWCSSI
jgi:hypothetical protein